jgi:dUTPase
VIYLCIWRGTERSAGFDLFSVTNTTIEPSGVALIETGIQVQLPVGTYGRIAPRSGLARKEMIGVGGTYTGLHSKTYTWFIHSVNYGDFQLVSSIQTMKAL